MFSTAFTIVGTALAVVIVFCLFWIAFCCVIGLANAILEYPIFFLGIAVIIALMFISAFTVNAQQHLPPVEYDKPYTGKLTIEVVTKAQLLATCSTANQGSLGCAFPGKDRCHIKLLDEASIQAAGWTVELMLRHERAHCNGWPGNHPGRRPYP